jgi:RNA polymerase sigma-70 factor (ECF subfamily)
MSERKDQPENPFDVTTGQRTALTNLAGPGISAEDVHLIELLRSGNESAFESLVDCHSAAMLRLAKVFVTTQAVAEEVVQETWMGVLEGLSRFEGRSSLKTWIFRILANHAKTRAQREGRSIPFSSLPDVDTAVISDSSEPAVDPDRFLPADHQRPGHWISFPSDWREMPEERLLSQETRACIDRTIEVLPPGQREVIILRDIEGWTSDETCSLLGISAANQRVLLHRARSKVRGALESYFEKE